MLVLNAHTVTDTSGEGFAVRLFRKGNQRGFVRAISDQPSSFASGFNKARPHTEPSPVLLAQKQGIIAFAACLSMCRCTVGQKQLSRQYMQSGVGSWADTVVIWVLRILAGHACRSRR